MPLWRDCSLPWEAKGVALSVIAVSSLDGCEFVLNSCPGQPCPGCFDLYKQIINHTDEVLTNSALQRRKVR